jgi:hypothetical protein
MVTSKLTVVVLPRESTVAVAEPVVALTAVAAPVVTRGAELT